MCTDELVDYLRRTLRSNVELLNIWDTVSSPDEYIPEMHFNESLSYGVALGLALGAFEK